MQGVKLVQILVSNWFETESIMPSGTLSFQIIYHPCSYLYASSVPKTNRIMEKRKFFSYSRTEHTGKKKKVSY